MGEDGAGADVQSQFFKGWLISTKASGIFNRGCLAPAFFVSPHHLTLLIRVKSLALLPLWDVWPNPCVSTILPGDTRILILQNMKNILRCFAGSCIKKKRIACV